MELLGRGKLHRFKQSHADARQKVDAWEAEIKKALWQTPYEMKQRFPSADPVGGQNTIFNIGKYRLWVMINYETQIILVKEIGTHEEYEKWNIK